MNMSAKNEDWDQEYTPKNKKYFLVCRDLYKHPFCITFLMQFLNNPAKKKKKKTTHTKKIHIICKSRTANIGYAPCILSDTFSLYI